MGWENWIRMMEFFYKYTSTMRIPWLQYTLSKDRYSFHWTSNIAPHEAFHANLRHTTDHHTKMSYGAHWEVQQKSVKRCAQLYLAVMCRHLLCQCCVPTIVIVQEHTGSGRADFQRVHTFSMFLINATCTIRITSVTKGVPWITHASYIPSRSTNAFDTEPRYKYHPWTVFGSFNADT